jgi:hypothetical protein
MNDASLKNEKGKVSAHWLNRTVLGIGTKGTLLFC